MHKWVTCVGLANTTRHHRIFSCLYHFAISFTKLILIIQQVWFKNRRAKCRQQQQSADGKIKPKKKPSTPKENVPKSSSTSPNAPYSQYQAYPTMWGSPNDQTIRSPTYPTSVIGNSMCNNSTSMMIPHSTPGRYHAGSQDRPFLPMGVYINRPMAPGVQHPIDFHEPSMQPLPISTASHSNNARV